MDLLHDPKHFATTFSLTTKPTTHALLKKPLKTPEEIHLQEAMMADSVKPLFFSLLILFSIFTISRSSDPDCVYTVYVRTGSILKAGTDSNITITLYDSAGYGIRINNLEAWGGLMGPGYNYFERGNLDIFSGRGPCLTAPICALNLTSDGSGPHHGWYVNYVEVTTTGVHKGCDQHNFEVEQWLATDTSPYELTAIKNDCSGEDVMIHGSDSSSSMVSVM